MAGLAQFVQDERVIVIATLFIEQSGDARQRFIPIFQEFLRHVHTEPGMNQFAVSVNKDFTEYGIYEEYKNRVAFEEHRDSSHSAEFNAKCKEGSDPIFPKNKLPVVNKYSPFRPRVV